MISKLTLKNFRCFHDFTLDNIKPVTLIAGTNSVGKSSLLEGIFLFVDRYSSNVFFKLNNLRGMPLNSLSPIMIWEHLFFNMDTANNISICVNNGDKTQTAIFSKDSSSSLSSLPVVPLPFNDHNRFIPMHDNYPLKLEYNDMAENDVVHFVITNDGIILSAKKQITTLTPNTYYYSSRIGFLPPEIAEFFGKIEFSGEKSKFIEIIKVLDSRIKDLSVIAVKGMVAIFADIGLSSKIPLNALGDGINKLTSIALIMLYHPGSIILLDEIENGFHYSFFPKLWEIIGKLVQKTGCQVFATTHSYECIKGTTALISNAESQDLFRLVRLDRNNGGVVPHVFDNDSFEYSINNEWELR